MKRFSGLIYEEKQSSRIINVNLTVGDNLPLFITDHRDFSLGDKRYNPGSSSILGKISLLFLTF